MQTTIIDKNQIQALSLDEWLKNPPESSEWLEGELIEKNNMTAKHGKVQARLAAYWINYKNSTQQGGEVYTETPCRTLQQGRCPDVAYLTPDLLEQYGDFMVLPQSFPLIAEIISPTDSAEDVFKKVNEYLQSGCQEVWLVLPESKWIIVITQQQKYLFTSGEIARTQVVLQGFGVEINELLN